MTAIKKRIDVKETAEAGKPRKKKPQQQQEKNQSQSARENLGATDAAPARRKSRELTSERLEKLLAFDRQILISGSLKRPAEVIIGTDEVGRGCLAGPVVACAVVLPRLDSQSEIFRSLMQLNDSKKVLPEVRAELAQTLRGICQFAIAEASVEEIDEINILQASLLAMRRAIRRLKVISPAVILIDGNKSIPSVRNHEQVTVIDGDTKSASIAAASIIAKVHRDSFMKKLAEKFPDYKWDSNKGYGSKDHREALARLGMTVWHRRSFNCGIDTEMDGIEEVEQLELDLELS